MTHCQTYIDRLRLLGYRITPQREMIIEALAHGNEHLTAEEIYTQVKDRSRAVNRATVYRTLDTLVEVGLVSRIDLRNGQALYSTDRHGLHLHLVCRRCGCVINAENGLTAALFQQLRDQYGFAVDLQHISMTGLCQDCLSGLSNEGG